LSSILAGSGRQDSRANSSSPLRRTKPDRPWDFNVNKGPLYDALTETGLTTPDVLNGVPRTIFDSPGKQHFYDQIAWFAENGNRSVLSLDFLSAGSFDFVPLLQGGL
jgi:hypothetical protein